MMVAQPFTSAALDDGGTIDIFPPIGQVYMTESAAQDAAQYRAEHSGRQKVCIFMGQDVTSLVLVNELIPKLRALNFEPVIFSVDPNPSHKEEAQHPQLHLIHNCQTLPIDQVVLPALTEGDRAKEIWEQNSANIEHVPLELFDQFHSVTPYLIPEKGVRDPNFAQAIAADDKIVGAISVRPYQIFQKPLIDAFQNKQFKRKNGGDEYVDIQGFFINVHPGPLPQMRGIYTPLHAMAQFKPDFAWSIHHINEGIDEGDVIKRVINRIDYNSHALALYTDFTTKVVDVLEQELAHLLHAGKFGRVSSQKALIRSGNITPVYYSYEQAVDVLGTWADLSDRVQDYNAALEPSDRLTYDEQGDACVIWDPAQLAHYYADKFGAGNEDLTQLIYKRVYGRLLQYNQEALGLNGKGQSTPPTPPANGTKPASDDANSKPVHEPEHQ